MASLVLELQQEASSGSTPLPDVLRKARMVATKLKLSDVNAWIEHELHGYPAEASVPTYRILHCQVVAHNPYNGLYIPCLFGDADFQQSLATVRSRQSIGSLHEVVTTESGVIRVPFDEYTLARLRDLIDEPSNQWMLPFRRLSKSQVTSIFDAVRNRILDWTLKLEAEGILGEGMTFTSQEKERAATMPSINIGSVGSIQGVVGSVTNSSLHIDNVQAVDSELKKQGLTADQRTEIQQIIAEYKAAPNEGKMAVATRGIKWVVENVDKLGALATMFRDYFGGHSG